MVGPSGGQSTASVCRLCFTERRQHELAFIGSQLQEWIEMLTSVKIVHVPNAPTSLCQVCKAILEGYDKFREMCHANDRMFQETFLQDGDDYQSKKRKIEVKDKFFVVEDKGSHTVTTMEVELGVEPCECTDEYETTLDDQEIKIEEVVVEKSPTDVKIISENDLSQDIVIEILRSDLSCQRLIREKLSHGISVANKDKSLICRTLCTPLFGSMIEHGIPVSWDIKLKLAQCIIAAYPCLGTQASGMPAEAEWFWRHSGHSKGEHSGKIHTWIRNAQAKAPASVRRKRRGTNLDLTDVEANAVEKLCLLDEQASYRKVNKLMIETFAYRQNLRDPKSGPSHLCAEFPHLLWYGPVMIEEEFDRMHPNRNTIGTLASISSLCLMLDHSYNEIACETIQALMKVMAELTLQGNIRKDSSSSGLSPLEEYASIFVRWQQPDTDLDYFAENVPGDPPYIVCSATAFSEGQYFVIIMNTAIDCGFTFGRAFDVLLKSYKVFNFPVPGRAKKVIELFDLFYGIQTHSRLANVNKLFDKISKASNRLLN